MSRKTLSLALLAGVALLSSGGCPAIQIQLPNGFITFPGYDIVTVELVNDTNYEVDPHIVFDDDTSFFAQLVPSDELDVHDLQPGEVVQADFDCDKLGFLFSDRPEQFTLLYTYTGVSSISLLRGHDFDCGDVIQFQYIGDGDAFDVVVSINGYVVY